MNLLLDIGNSRIKWALVNDGQWQAGEPLVRADKAFKDIARPAWQSLEPPQRVIVSNVAGEDYARLVRTWIKRRWKLEPEFLQADVECAGVVNAYPHPQRLGSDRWACLLAAHALYDAPVCIVDCGSAVTVDALAADGRHLGGLIVPGLEMMVGALTSRAPGVALSEDEPPAVSLLGRDTASAVNGGALYTVVSLLDRVFVDIVGELGESTVSVITGGDAPRVLPLLSVTPPRHVPDLVLKGLEVYAKETACVT